MRVLVVGSKTFRLHLPDQSSKVLLGYSACSTCHVIVDSQHFDLLEEPTDEENDMLDLAFGLTDTSRLGCQIKMRKDLEGMVLQLPSATRNMAVDGFKPKPH